MPEFHSAKLMTTDRMALIIHPESHPFFTLTELKLYVGGPIMLLRPESLTGMEPVLVVNENAGSDSDALNTLASEVMDDYVWGQAVLCISAQLEDAPGPGLTDDSLTISY